MGELDKLRERDFRYHDDWHKNLYDAAASLLALRKIDILDVGCGVGYGLVALEARGMRGTWTGIDKDPDVISWITEQNGGKKSAFAQCVDFLDANYGEAKQYDVALCIETLDDVPESDRELFISKLCTVAKSLVILSETTLASYAEPIGWRCVAIPTDKTRLWVYERM